VPSEAKRGGGAFLARVPAPVVGLRVEGAPAGASSELSATAHVAWLDGASAGIDPYDAYELTAPTSTRLGLFSVDEAGDAFDIRTLPRTDGSAEIAFDVTAAVGGAPAGGTFTLTWPELRDVPETWSLVLLDTQTNEHIDLRTASSYRFSMAAARTAAAVSSEGPFPQRVRARSATPRFRLFVESASGRTAGLADAEALAKPQLERPYPNPFADATTVGYTLPNAGPVRLVVYDLLGREVAVLVDGVQEAGPHTARFDGSALASGLYLVRLDADGVTTTHRVSLAR
jgi:hypothetical protein